MSPTNAMRTAAWMGAALCLPALSGRLGQSAHRSGSAPLAGVAIALGPQQSQQTMPPSLGAPAESSQTSTGQIVVSSALVVVPVTVKDRSGSLVNLLQPEDFHVFEDGVEQHIRLFALDPSPLSAVVLLDNALGRANAEQVHKSLRAIAGGFAANDEVNVIRFDHYPEENSVFIQDPDRLLTELSHISLSGDIDAPAGGPFTLSPLSSNGQPAPGAPDVTQKPAVTGVTKSINDAVYAAALRLRSRPRERRRIIFLVSDGENSKRNVHGFNDTVRMLVSSEVAVYSIGVGGMFFDRGFNVLGRLAHASGGDVFYAGRESSLESLYARVADQARNQYTLGYMPGHQDRVITYHSVEVRVRRAGLTVLARDGYYSSPRR